MNKPTSYRPVAGILLSACTLCFPLLLLVLLPFIGLIQGSIFDALMGTHLLPVFLCIGLIVGGTSLYSTPKLEKKLPSVLGLTREERLQTYMTTRDKVKSTFKRPTPKQFAIGLLQTAVLALCSAVIVNWAFPAQVTAFLAISGWQGSIYMLTGLGVVLMRTMHTFTSVGVTLLVQYLTMHMLNWSIGQVEHDLARERDIFANQNATLAASRG